MKGKPHADRCFKRGSTEIPATISFQNPCSRDLKVPARLATQSILLPFAQMDQDARCQHRGADHRGHQHYHQQARVRSGNVPYGDCDDAGGTSQHHRADNYQEVSDNSHQVAQ